MYRCECVRSVYVLAFLCVCVFLRVPGEAVAVSHTGRFLLRAHFHSGRVNSLGF